MTSHRFVLLSAVAGDMAAALTSSASAAAALTEAEHSSCIRLLFGTAPVAEDVARWYQQGVDFADDDASCRFPIGLKQRNGGPCGILASIQAWMLRLCMFPDHGTPMVPLSRSSAPLLPDKQTTVVAAAAASSSSACDPAGTTSDPLSVDTAAPAAASPCEASPFAPVTIEQRQRLLAGGIAAPLWQAAVSPSPADASIADQLAPLPGAAVRLVGPASASGSPLSAASAASDWVSRKVSSYEALVDLVQSRLDELSKPHGVMCLVLSLLLSRGVEKIISEMDEADKPMVARFGHCEQEVVSLMLTGAATTNAFDGVKPLFEGSEGTDLVVRGIQRTPPIGYLSQMETLRYTEVGSFFKNPEVPVWVVGSTSHFTVLFSASLSCNLPDPSTAVRRLFDRHDVSNAGMIPLEDVPALLAELDLPIARQPMQCRSMVKRLDKGIGQVVWTDFWPEVRPMVVELQPGEPAAAIVDEVEVETEARSKFNALDAIGGGFINMAHVRAVLTSLGETKCLVGALYGR